MYRYTSVHKSGIRTQGSYTGYSPSSTGEGEARPHAEHTDSERLPSEGVPVRTTGETERGGSYSGAAEHSPRAGRGHCPRSAAAGGGRGACHKGGRSEQGTSRGVRDHGGDVTSEPRDDRPRGAGEESRSWRGARRCPGRARRGRAARLPGSGGARGPGPGTGVGPGEDSGRAAAAGKVPGGRREPAGRE